MNPKQNTPVKILIVDDEHLDLFITKRLLSLEFQVEGFTSVSEAVKWSQSNAFDVLLSDYYMGNGIHAHDVLRAIVAVKKVPFKAVVLSNHIDGEQAEALKKAGFSAIIEKPITLEKFRETVGQ
jgi:DNA-binding NtrC family response regulator